MQENSAPARILPVNEANLAVFLAYCAARGPEHDESFLPGPGFAPDADHPSFLLDRGGDAGGAVSLLLGPSFRDARRSRFAILHAASGAREDYRALLSEASRAASPAADELFLFLPGGKTVPGAYLEEAGFIEERIAYAMVRESLDQEPPLPPEGYALAPLAPGDEEGARSYAEVRNRNFREVPGALPLDRERVLADLASPDVPPGGLSVLHAPDGSACGTLRVERDVEADCLSVGGLTVDREHRARGLGRFLLRAAADIGRREGYRKASLSVDASNGKALGLYQSEGYTVQAVWRCLSARVSELADRLEADGGGRP